MLLYSCLANKFQTTKKWLYEIQKNLYIKKFYWHQCRSFASSLSHRYHRQTMQQIQLLLNERTAASAVQQKN